MWRRLGGPGLGRWAESGGIVSCFELVIVWIDVGVFLSIAIVRVNCADRIAINTRVDLTTGFIVEKQETHKQLTKSLHIDICKEFASTPSTTKTDIFFIDVPTSST